MNPETFFKGPATFEGYLVRQLGLLRYASLTEPLPVMLVRTLLAISHADDRICWHKHPGWRLLAKEGVRN